MREETQSPWMLTFMGERFDLVHPQPEKIRIKDIAHALALTCRWGGQSRSFYSVAQHSVMVSLDVPAQHALAALLHDATEAYLGGVISPLKKLLPDYKKIEEQVWKCIAQRFSLPVEMAPEIVRADRRAMATEYLHIGSGPELWDVTEHLSGEAPMLWFDPMEPARAESQFLKRFVELTTNLPTSKLW